MATDLNTYLAQQGYGSLSALGKIAGVSRNYLWQVKEGRRPCSLKVARALEKGTGGEISARMILRYNLDRDEPNAGN